MTATSTINELQDRVNAALIGSDWPTLTELVAKDARITGPKGFMIGRDEWLDVHQQSGYQQVRLEPTQTETVAFDTAGVRVDTIESECRYHGETITGRFRVTQTWVTDAGRWQLAAIQYTSITG
jgi:hypothetical protein